MPKAQWSYFPNLNIGACALISRSLFSRYQEVTFDVETVPDNPQCMAAEAQRRRGRWSVLRSSRAPPVIRSSLSLISSPASFFLPRLPQPPWPPFGSLSQTNLVLSQVLLPGTFLLRPLQDSSLPIIPKVTFSQSLFFIAITPRCPLGTLDSITVSFFCLVFTSPRTSYVCSCSLPPPYQSRQVSLMRHVSASLSAPRTAPGTQ